MTLGDFIRLYGTDACTVAANDVFRKLFRQDIATYFRTGGNAKTLEADLRKVTAALTVDEIEKLAGIFSMQVDVLEA